MNAVVVESYEHPPRYAVFADPNPTGDEVLITVAAAGLHPIVKSLAKGSHYGSTGQFPFVPGVDGVGRTPQGERVFFGAAHPPFGTFAERSLAKPAFCVPIPDALDDATVAAMMNPAMASWGALEHRAHFASGESILILGATGCAGGMAVQVARRFGAKRIVAVGRNPKSLEETKSLGADATIPLHQDHDALVSAFRAELAQGIDVVLDYLWGAPAEALLAAVAQKGDGARLRYVEVGSAAGPNITLPGATLRSSGLELLGSGFGSVPMSKVFASLHAVVQSAAKEPFTIKHVTAPLRDVEKLWDVHEDGRLVFVP
jgi:NADPH2:quinone reductase